MPFTKISENIIFSRTKQVFRGRSRPAATSKMECFVIIVNDWKPLTIITKHSILDVAADLDPPLSFHSSILTFVFQERLRLLYFFSENTFLCTFQLKGTVMQIEKALINDRLRVSKVSLKVSHSNCL